MICFRWRGHPLQTEGQSCLLLYNNFAKSVPQTDVFLTTYPRGHLELFLFTVTELVKEFPLFGHKILSAFLQKPITG
jgi:hypothetical protein